METQTLPWMDTEPVEGTPLVRVAWIRHSDAFRDGGRAGAHRGPCTHDAAHALLWHLCSGLVVLRAKAETEAEWLEYPRWVVTAGPVLDGRKCCGLHWELATETVKAEMR